MLITNLKLKNWRNFSNVDVPLGPRIYLIGANAAGKSNFLDVFRFLRTVAQSDGGGLQKALKERGGIKKLRSLHVRTDTEVRIEVEVAESIDADSERWRYILAFKPEGKGKQRLLITDESVWHENTLILERPEPDDRKDVAQLTQTYLEQINNNGKFRELAEFFAGTTYLHLVPQLLKHSDEISGRVLVSTHSEKLLAAIGDPGTVLILEPGENGTKVRPPKADELKAMRYGMNPAEVLLPKTRPKNVNQMGLFARSGGGELAIVRSRDFCLVS